MVIGLCDVYVLFLVEQKVNKEELIPCLQAGSDGASNSEKEENNCGWDSKEKGHLLNFYATHSHTKWCLQADNLIFLRVDLWMQP